MKNTGDVRAQRTIASFVEILGQKPYVTHTARDLLWGYDNQLLSLAKTINDAAVFPEDKIYPYDQFGFFVGVIVYSHISIFQLFENYISRYFLDKVLTVFYNIVLEK